MYLRSVYILVYLGFVGFAIFLLLRPAVDFHASAPIELSRTSAEERGREVLRILSLDPDTLAVMARPVQRIAFYKMLTADGADRTSITPAHLTNSGYPLGGWNIMYSGSYDEVTAIVSDDVLFEQIGSMRVALDNQGRVRNLRAGSSHSDVFVEGDSLSEVLHTLLTSFGYNPSFYITESDTAFNDTEFIQSVPLREQDVIRYGNQTGSTGNYNGREKIRLDRIGTSGVGPDYIEITIVPDYLVTETDTSFSITYGVRPVQFLAAYHDNDAETLAGESPVEIIFSIFSILLIVVICMVAGLRQLSRGEVIWGRGLRIFIALFIAFVLYRSLILINLYFRVLDANVITIDVLLSMLVGAIQASFVALAYITWESLARKQDQEQVPHVDAIWGWNIFQKKIGKAFLAAYGYAGLALAVWAIVLYAFDMVYYQYDGQFGFLEPSSSYPSLTAMLNGVLYSWLGAVVVVGVPVSVLMNFVNRSSVLVAIGSILAGLFMSKGIMFVATTGSAFIELFAFAALAFPLILAFRYYGILTLAVSFWLIFLSVRIFLYYGSPDPNVEIHGYVLIIGFFIPLIFGLLAHHYGRNDLRESRFIPDYEKRLKKQMQMEREFQIAKESQYALMPKSPPQVENIDIRGFFVPSFDVGGDFYDHIVLKDSSGRPEKMVMAVVDVSGKGMKAALTAIFTSGLLLSRMNSSDNDPSQVLNGINGVLLDRIERQMFITSILAVLDISSGKVDFVNAGHCKPVLVRKGSAILVESEGLRLPLGIRDDTRYTTTSFILQPGDTLYFYSDGLPEAKSRSGAMFGYDRVPSFFERITKQETKSSTICERIKKEVLEFSEYDLADDLTVLVVRF